MPIPGVDYLGGAKYPTQIVQAHPRQWAAGIFYSTFGDADSTIRLMCQSQKFSEIVVHMAKFDRSHRYVISRNLPRLRRYATRLELVALSCPGTKILLSPFCEHDHKAKVMRPVFRVISRLAPSTIMVNSILRGERIPGIITEIHLEGSKPLPAPPRGQYIVSLDGYTKELSRANLEAITAKYKTARQIRIWSFRLNGKVSNEDKTPIAERYNWPNSQYLKSLANKLRQAFIKVGIYGSTIT